MPPRYPTTHAPIPAHDDAGLVEHVDRVIPNALDQQSESFLGVAQGLILVRQEPQLRVGRFTGCVE